MTKEFSFEFVTATAAIEDFVNRCQMRLVDYKEIKKALKVSMPQLKYALNELVEEGVLRPVDGRGVYLKCDWETRQRPCSVRDVRDEINMVMAEALFWEDAGRFSAKIKSTKVS